MRSEMYSEDSSAFFVLKNVVVYTIVSHQREFRAVALLLERLGV